MPAPTQILSVRVSPRERELLAIAAEGERTNVSEFVRRKAVEAAEAELMERRLVTIPAADWERFEAWAERAPEDKPLLRQLSERKAAWRD